MGSIKNLRVPRKRIGTGINDLGMMLKTKPIRKESTHDTITFTRK